MKKFLVLACAMGAALFCSSCSEEDHGVTAIEIKESLYNNAFQQTFKVPDTQTWDYAAAADPNARARRYFCEDLAKTDFDFNDIVFDIVLKDKGYDVIIQAVGGTLPIKLKVGDMGNNYVGTGELHAQFGVDTNVPINVGANGVTKEPLIVPINANNIKSFDDFKSIMAEVTYEGTTHQIKFVPNASVENAAKIISVPVSTRWMKENQSIDLGYNAPLIDDWYNNIKDESKLY